MIHFTPDLAHLASGGTYRKRDDCEIGNLRNCAGEAVVGIERFIDRAYHELWSGETQVGD